MHPHTPPNSRAILVACMPKSGSTFLSALLASVPGFRRDHIVPSYKRREQELSETKIQQAFQTTQVLRRAYDQKQLNVSHRPRGFVCQNHLRHSHETQHLLDKYEIVPIVLVRNIFDVVISLRDHVVKQSVYTPTAYVDETVQEWDDDRRHAFLVDMAIPWYIHFYVSWMKAESGHFVTYERLIANPEDTLRKALASGKLPRSQEIISDALETVQGVGTRKNVGGAGRGAELPQELKDRIHRYCAYYPDVDFSMIGIK